MKRLCGCSLLVCWLAGCSTHPLVDVCDYFRPGKLGPNEVQPYGGVWAQQHPITPLSPTLPPLTPAFPPPPGGGFVPPPAPLPGGRPTTGFQLQPPTPPGDVPPLPPAPPPSFGR